MKSKIWLSSPHIDKNELDYVKETFLDNWIAPVGPHIFGFEVAIETFLKRPSFVTAVTSGTAAIHLALKLLNIKAGDTVLCQSFTFIATANPITYLGAIPVFVDSETETWNMCPYYLEEAIKEGLKLNKKPKAIIIVDLYGMPAKMDEIIEIATQYDIPIIEDAAEALGSEYKNRKCGTFGDFSIFSFNGNKIITSSGGGALVCRNSADKEKTLFYATQAKEVALHYQHEEVGFNYRLSNVCAAIGKGQMEVLSKRIIQRQANHLFYQELFKGNKDVTVFKTDNTDFNSNYWLTCVLIGPQASFSNLDLIKYLGLHNIEARPLWKPLHLQPVFENTLFYGGNVCSDLFSRGVCLPSGSNMSLVERLFIAKVLTEFFKSK
ncbi:DegT/DnrJ/EryC1/StrS family aminotransferase [Olleya sp. Bg11-27]|uniref:DegT/DnrJ/EryC1/StrS family aminotransferase n=1 Tax=Olleya sp. Bg11-27 TaxID=2058135 RepID=UPI000C31607D|nr:DegT/DnrJ/EryC1/StrS family aminotransferase [Olleya sp. Bg11-27]AUC74754.1 pyridoxal phosphate-dependent aminotransferase [Olleya sp. Bg11-27]